MFKSVMARRPWAAVVAQLFVVMLLLAGCSEDTGSSGNRTTLVPMQPGTMTPGTMTPGTMTPGTMTPGTMTPGTMTPGTMTPGTMTPGMDTMTPGTDEMTPGMDTMPMAGVGGGDNTGTMSEAQTCIDDAAAMGMTDACTVCGCTNCTAEINDCADDACRAIVDCGRAAGCSGSDCYCGIGADPIVCALTGATGPCMQEIVDASGLLGTEGCTSVELCASPLTMLGDTDPTNAVERASALSVCSQGQEASDGVPLANIPPSEAIAGMCETECN